MKRTDSCPLVSIIIPVYNTEQYLRQCLDSVIRQTERNIEIICVDDGSSDSSYEILEEYRAKDSRIVLVRQENGGTSVARNVGISIASGKYLLFVDSDDEAAPTLCQKTVEIADKYDSQILLVADDSRIKRLLRHFPRFRRLYDPQMFERGCYDDLTTNQRRLLTYFAGTFGAGVLLFRRSYWNEQKLEYPKGIRISQDLSMNFQAFAKVERVAFLKARLYFVRSREDSATHKDLGKRLGARIDKFEVFRRAREKYSENAPYLQEPLVELGLYSWRNMSLGLPEEERQIWKRNVDAVVDSSILEAIYSKDRLPFKIRQFWLEYYGRSSWERTVASLWTRFFADMLLLERFFRTKVKPLIRKRKQRRVITPSFF